MATVVTVMRSRRGCGMQKPGGIYLRSEGLSSPCGKFPIRLNVCPCCGAGIKYSRGYGWISNKIILEAPCAGLGRLNFECNPQCSVKDPEIIGERLLIIWIGEQFYPTASDFQREASRKEHDGSPMGVSRRVKAIPRRFKIGETWIALAHNAAVMEDGELKPGIFELWKPTFIEYIVTGQETEEELNELEARGFRLINVVEYSQQTSMFD